VKNRFQSLPFKFQLAALHIGVSNFSEKKIRDIVSYARHPMSVCQVEIHPYWQGWWQHFSPRHFAVKTRFN
jgi:predicted oxidoreductase